MTECANPKCEFYISTAQTCCCRKCSNNLNSIRNAEKRKVEREARLRQFFIDNPQPKCANPECNNLCYFRERYWKWSVCCSTSCVTKYTQFIAKQDKEQYNEKIARQQQTRKESWAKMSDEERELKNLKALEKRKATFLERYGTDNVQEKPEVVEKRKKTMQMRYGVDTAFHSDAIQQKIEQTMIDKYGVIKPLQNKDIKQKQKQTNLERYGSEEVGGLFTEQAKATTLERYGHEYYTQTDEYRKRRQDTMINRYGGCSHAYVNYTELGRELMKPENFNKIVDLNQEMSLTEIAVTHGMSLGALVQRFAAHGVQPKIHYTSMFHKQVVNFLKTECNIENIIENNRTIIAPRELDILIGSLAIECNGLFWHSERQLLETKSLNIDVKSYHLNKTNECGKQGIHLIHLWQNIWDTKRDICKSIIKSNLGLYENNVYGRKTTICYVDRDQEQQFLNANHIQGYVPSAICLGLYQDAELLSVMSFGKSRFTEKYQYELLRFCNKLNTRVIGGANKLCSHFIRTYAPSSIVSYCHRHMFSGDVYRKLGFSHDHTSPPSYWYTKDYRNVYNRQKFQKHKLKDLLEKFDDQLSEWDNMIANGWDRIWDCGNDVYVWKPEMIWQQ